MKARLWLINLGLVIYLAGLLSTIGFGTQAGAILVLIASVLLGIIGLSQLISFLKKSKRAIAFSILGALFILSIIFIHGFSTSIDMMLLYRLETFTWLYLIAGVMLLILFVYYSIKTTSTTSDKKWVIGGTSFAVIMGFGGLLGVAQIVPLSGRLIFYSWVFLLFFYLAFFIFSVIRKNDPRAESMKLLVLCIAMIGFWVVRFNISGFSEGLTKAVFDYAFVPLLILPLSILFAKKYYSFIIFIFYFILLDFFFIQFDSNFNYLITVGIHGCEGYDQSAEYPINSDPGLPIKELLIEPTLDELSEIIVEWQHKDFTPSDVLEVYKEEMLNGDSIKVISHLVNGLLHYGAIRIPKGLDIQTAPILLELEGGGTGLDVSKTSTLTSGKCKQERNNYISILPSYRGNLIRGKNFCFRSQGYAGDAWLGAAEDAISFLEAVKSLYRKSDSVKVLAQGISRGATVALIIGSLTDKIDFIIVNSTHTKFLDRHVIANERVGGSFSRAFYTPKASGNQIRKRIIASSPYYFAEYLPPFELHQGTEDKLTTVWHARALEKRLEEIKKDTSTYKFFIYEGKGHGYDDDRAVCISLNNFAIANGKKADI
jgi:hypothetical protein